MIPFIVWALWLFISGKSCIFTTKKMMLTSFSLNLRVHNTGADPGFPFRGGGGGGRAQRLCASTHKHAEPNSLSAGEQGPLKGPGSSRVVLMLSRAIWALFFKHSDFKKNWGGGGIVDPILRGVAPPWIRHCIIWNLKWSKFWSSLIIINAEHQKLRKFSAWDTRILRNRKKIKDTLS